MSKGTKIICWCAIVVVMLTLCATVLVPWRKQQEATSWNLSEVIGFVFFYTDCVLYVEKETESADSKEVFFLCEGPVLPLTQYYIIEGSAVKNYHWGPDHEKDVYVHSWLNRMALPAQTQTSGKEANAREAATSITSIANLWKPNDFNTRPTETFDVLKWSGATDKTSHGVIDFCNFIIANACGPAYAKNNPFSWRSNKSTEHDYSSLSQYGHRIYPSYMRAIPLFTEEELTRAKDVPLIDGEGNVPVQIAADAPYLLIPIKDKKSPFPSLGKPYEPGRDRVRFQAGIERHFLIETFKGEGWKD